MPTLFWSIRWEWGVYRIEAELEAALIQAIRPRILGKQIRDGDVGLSLDGLAVSLQHTRIPFTATLERIEPLVSFVVGLDTTFRLRLAMPSAAAHPRAPGQDAHPSSLGAEIDDFVMWQVTFDPFESETHYAHIYTSLVGTNKEVILEEMISLLAPTEVKERWSIEHYQTVVPLVRAIATKAPVIVFGGDPGTGKTALATSIGAPLAWRIGERVHFRHMSLLMRGMGYQGRAGAMIVKSFERIKEEYTRLHEPMLLFFDEAEAIVGSRKQADQSSGSQENIAIVDAIIVGVDSLRKGSLARIVVVFATNLVDHIDSALMRRCYYHTFERPDEQTRRALLTSSLQGMGLSEMDFNRLVDATQPRVVNDVLIPFTHADIVELIVGRALHRAIQANRPLSLDLLLEHCGSALPSGSLARQSIGNRSRE
jgi:AAA+ superfamily predicted ATPase